MNWFRNFKDQINKFMYGRYGVDELSMALMILSIVLGIVLEFLPGLFKFLIILSYIPIVISLYRIFSKNIFIRQKEYYRYLSFKNSIFSKLKKYQKRIKDSKTHKYFKCPNCHQELRVPKGNGKITITCPKCKTSFKGKS